MINEIKYKAAVQEDFPDLAKWLVDISQIPKQHCIHTWSGQNIDVLAQDLEGYWKDSELCYILASRNEKLVGAMGAEFDEELGRAWLHGPHSITEQWEAVASELYSRLLTGLPLCLKQVEAYLGTQNVKGRRFYSERVFKEMAQFSYDYWLTPSERISSNEKRVDILSSLIAQKPIQSSFVRLFEGIFPNAYYSVERILRMVGKSHQILVIAEEGEVSGFAVASVDEGLSMGEIQFLGV